MRYVIAVHMCFVLLLNATLAAARENTLLLTKEVCARLEDTFSHRPHKPEERSFYQSNEYRQCRDAAFSMEPNAGLEILNALSGEGEALDLTSDIQKLEQRLFYITVGTVKIIPPYLQCCYEVKQERWCQGIFADDSEHLDSIDFEALTLTVGKAESLTLHADKPNYVLHSLFFEGQAISFRPAEYARQDGQKASAWEATLPAMAQASGGEPFAVHPLIAIFAWNGKDSANSTLGHFRKAVWYYTAR